MISLAFGFLFLGVFNRVRDWLDQAFGSPSGSTILEWSAGLLFLIAVLYLLKRRPTFVGVSDDELAIGSRNDKGLLLAPLTKSISAELRPALVLRMNGEELWFEPGKRPQMKECIRLINERTPNHVRTRRNKGCNAERL